MVGEQGGDERLRCAVTHPPPHGSVGLDNYRVSNVGVESARVADAKEPQRSYMGPVGIERPQGAGRLKEDGRDRFQCGDIGGVSRIARRVEIYDAVDSLWMGPRHRGDLDSTHGMTGEMSL